MATIVQLIRKAQRMRRNTYVHLFENTLEVFKHPKLATKFIKLLLTAYIFI